MVERARFHLDEHIDRAAARALRQHGVDVTTTAEAGLRAKDDAAHLDFIRRERRVMVTRDRDFLRLAAQSIEHPGIVYCTTHSIGEIVRGLMLIYEVLSPEELRGQVEYV